MAKSKSFFGLRKGSTKTMTYSVLRGQQITKDRVTDIANPRSMDQTLQRIPFAQAVKFYKQATKGLFRFAYEDKRPLESDYNAFMRHNVKYASSTSIDNYRNNFYPAFGNWLVSSGSLGESEVRISGSMVQLAVAGATSAVTTVGGVSSLILARYPDLVEGDIVTFVCFLSTLRSDGGFVSQVSPFMNFVQFVINTEDSTTLESLGFEDINVSDDLLSCDMGSGISAFAGAVIFSRNTPSGLKVSPAPIKGNEVWRTYLTANNAPTVIAGNAYSWGAAEKAILQGSLSD